MPDGATLVRVAIRGQDRVGQDVASNRALERLGDVFGVRRAADDALPPWAFEQLRKRLMQVTLLDIKL